MMPNEETCCPIPVRFETVRNAGLTIVVNTLYGEQIVIDHAVVVMRFALIAQGELVHVASYISLPVAPPDYDMAEAIKVRAAAHSFEGKLFTVVSCSTIS